VSAPRPQRIDIPCFPFTGAQVIEASAGTGKTWTLASLYLRLVLGEGPTGKPLRPPDILVMTFTDAATQELRERIRQRLAEAQAWFSGRLATAPDDTLAALRAQRPEAGWAADARLLEAAGHWMDEAAIHTIHGWSHRMLRQHAFDSRSLFDQQRVEDPRSLLQEITREYWRRWIYAADPRGLLGVDKLPGDPDTLLARIAVPMARLDRDPASASAAPPPPPTALFATAARWYRQRRAADLTARALWREHCEAIEAALRDAMATVLDGGKYQARYREGFLRRMRAWCDGDDVDLKDLARFSLSRLRALTKQGRTEPTDSFGAFAALDAVVEAGDPPVADPLLDHAAHEIRARLAARKQQTATFDFNDLLQRLFQALQAPDGRLARAIRRQYPVALVDEFQDTDPWQFGALERIYLDPHPEPAALVMIGDPKQAIYGFRGADLDTYMRARDGAQGIHTLSRNFRSTRPLVEAVNHVFGTAPRPFGDLPYVAVETGRNDIAPLHDPAGRELPAMTVWYAPGTDKATPLRERFAEGFATRIVTLLAASDLEPKDIAVLVRTGDEARRVRESLRLRGLRSVYLSDRDSVYASDEAWDLWQLLRAVATPRVAASIRAALFTRSFGPPAERLAGLFDDEDAFERQLEDFARWQQLWQQRGVLAMLYAVLHEREVPASLLALEGGERRLTNLLHLGDLLQQASLGLQGEVALVRFLGEQLLEPATGNDAAQMRLETDAELVKVVTMHKSKGLQYPAVFVPFAFDFRMARKQDLDDSDAHRIDEDIRLLYVAFTRAERALFVGAATRKDDLSATAAGDAKSALGRLLDRHQPDDLPGKLGAWDSFPSVQVGLLPEATPTAVAESPPPLAIRHAATPRRRHASRWRSTSFSSLTRGLVHAAAPALPLPPDEGDERFDDAQVDNPVAAAAAPPTAAPSRYAGFPAGAAYGDLLHGLLEVQLKAGWPLCQDPADAASLALLARRATALGLTSDAQAVLAGWLPAIARCPLGLSKDSGRDACLADLPPGQTWAEMGFVLTTQGVDATTLDRVVRSHVLPGQPRDPLPPAALEGLLTGFLDLVFEHDGRYYVLDYKSNRLPDYAPATLAGAILQHRYDLQYALYLLALHRLLRVRLPDYDYDRHMGGAIYLFARGIGSPGDGIYRDRPPRALVEALDVACREAP